jgi:hypothetical protein
VNIWTKKEEETEGQRELHNMELHNLYTLSNVIRVNKPRSMRRVEHVAYMGEMQKCIHCCSRKN